MQIVFFENSELGNRKLVTAGKIYDIEELNITEKQAHSLIINDIAEEVT